MSLQIRWTIFPVVILLGACAPLFHDELGNHAKVKRGTTTVEVVQLLGPPRWKSAPPSVDEWRYCATQSPSDLIVVLFFQNDVVIEKSSYRVDLNHHFYSEATGARIGSCVDTISNDGPRRVQKIREALNASAAPRR